MLVFIKKGYLKIVACLALLSFVLSFSFSINSYYSSVFLLPIFFFIFNVFFWKTLKGFHDNLIFLVIFGQMTIRYVLLPALISFGSPLVAGNTSINGNYAVFLMLYEMLFVFVGLKIAGKRDSSKSTERKTGIEFLKLNFVVVVILISGLLYILASSNFLLKINFVWNMLDYVTEVDAKEAAKSAGGLINIVFFRYRILLILILFGILWKFSKLSSFYKWLFSFVLILINATIIVGTSRLSIIYISFPFIVILMELYPNYRKRMLNLGAVFFLIILLVSSLFKFTRNDQVAQADELISAGSLNAYFAGPGNVSTGIDIYEERYHKSRFAFIYNDLFQNIPALSEKTNEEYQTTPPFNRKIYGSYYISDQIVPVSIASLFHFGYIFSFLYSFVLVILAFWFQSKATSSSFIASKYIFYLLALNCALFMMLNISSIFSNIVSHIVLSLIPFLIIRRFSYFFSPKKVFR